MTFHPKSVLPMGGVLKDEKLHSHPTAQSGAYGWLTGYLIEMARHNPALGARLLTLPRREVHFIALTIAMMGDKSDDTDHLAAFARDHGLVSNRASFKRAVPHAPTGLAKMSARLAGGLWRRSSYTRLAELAAEPQSAKVLRHKRVISRRDLQTLSRLPAGFRSNILLEEIDKPTNVRSYAFAINLVRAVRRDLCDAQILASLEKQMPTPPNIWAEEHFQKAPFPSAPTNALVINGVEALRPLTSYAELSRAAAEFSNCIRNFLFEVLRGETYFYRYAPIAGGPGVAIVELKRVPVVGWVVFEALGKNNDRINATDRAKIIAAFKARGIEATPQAVDPRGVWFDI